MIMSGYIEKCIFLFCIIFLYSALSAGTAKAGAEVTVSPGCTYCCAECGTCVQNGAGASASSAILAVLNTTLNSSISTVQTYLITVFGQATNSILNRANSLMSVITGFKSLEEIEMSIRDYWENLYQMAMLPAFQKMTEQLNAGYADQARNFQSMLDASGEIELRLDGNVTAVKDFRESKSGDISTVLATVFGGMGRAQSFSKSMQLALQNDSNAIGSNKLGTAGATGVLVAEQQRYNDYYNIFCNPESAGGSNQCGTSDPDFYDADIKLTKNIYNRLTIPLNPAVDPDKKMSAAVKAIITNLVGSTAADPMVLSVIDTSGGQQNFLDRRAYLARHAAIRSVPQIIAGWRMPGSKVGQWVEELRLDSDVPLAEIGNNPSYKEILHAVSVDRFNSSKYALKLIADETEVEMEKLILSAFYLMQLRDYYELLERTALVLAVQVSIMADRIPVPDALAASPLE